MNLKIQPFLKGNRIYLRGLCDEDSKSHYPAWFNDQDVCLYNSHGLYPYNERMCSDYISMVNASSKFLVLAVILKENNRHIGNVSLQEIDYISGSAEFAIILGEKDVWGQGLGIEAARLIMDHGFMRLNLNRIHCGTASSNQAMRKMALKLGMQQEGVRREAFYINGDYVDCIEYGILKKDYLP